MAKLESRTASSIVGPNHETFTQWRFRKGFTTRIVLTLLAFAVVLSGCSRNNIEGETMSATPSSQSPDVLAWLQNPTAQQIQTQTQPPYGRSGTPLPDGAMTPISTDAAAARGLAAGDTLNAHYAVVQNMYKAILFPQLVSQLGLAEYDAQMAQHGIPALPETSMSFAQYAQRCIGVQLSYLYIRNNVYVERLSQEQIDSFLSHSNDPDFVSDQGLRQIVTDTYPRVIRLLDTDEQVKTAFDTTGRFYDNDAIVINLAFGSTDDEINSEGRFNQLHTDRLAFVRDTIVPTLEQDLSQRWSGHISLYWNWERVRST